MKTKIDNTKTDNKATEFTEYTNEELAEAFIFPSDQPISDEEKQEENNFWAQRRKQFGNRSEKQKIYSRLLQLKFQLEDYIGSNQYNKTLSFGYFLNEYVTRQEKKNKEFALEVDVKPTVLSQYINNHRKPTEQFIIRLELHSNSLIPALAWLKLLQKDKENKIVTDSELRFEESSHVTGHLEIAY